MNSLSDHAGDNGSNNAPDGGSAFGVYIHWPFCLSKCPYCDFNSHVRRAAIDEARFLRAFLSEISASAARVPGRTVTSIFFGGGTPSLMQPSTVGAILDGVGRAWTVAADVEVTLEANPTSVEATRFRGYRAAGVNRVSLGVQALDDRVLAELGRMHTSREALEAVGIARSIFDRYSFDLIYARPRQDPKDWAAELTRALAEAGDHLSLYQLTIEQDTPFAALHAAGKLVLPDDDLGRELSDTTLEICSAHGLPAYEISNHTLAAEESADEFLLMGVRLAEGIDIARFQALAGRSLDPARIAMLHEHGLVETTASGRLRVTLPGFPVLDAVVADLAA